MKLNNPIKTQQACTGCINMINALSWFLEKKWGKINIYLMNNRAWITQSFGNNRHRPFYMFPDNGSPWQKSLMRILYSRTPPNEHSGWANTSLKWTILAGPKQFFFITMFKNPSSNGQPHFPGRTNSSNGPIVSVSRGFVPSYHDREGTSPFVIAIET